MGFDDYKKRTKSDSYAGDLQDKLEKLGGGGYTKDPTIWAPKTDDNKNSYSVLRLLPPPDGEELPIVRRVRYYFNGPGGRFSENCPSSIGLPSPMEEYYRKCWRENDEAAAKSCGRVQDFFANIVVLKESKAPENEGKNFKFRFGKKLFDKIKDKAKSPYGDEESVNVFDMFTGVNFKLKTKDMGGNMNYDDSEFGSQGPLFDGDEDLMREAYEGMYSLQELLDPKNFLPYEELKQKFYKAMGWEYEAPDEDEKPTSKKESKPAPKSEKTKVADMKPTTLDEDEIPDFSKKGKGSDEDDEPENPAPKKESKPAPKKTDDEEDEKPTVKKDTKKTTKPPVKTDDEEDEKPTSKKDTPKPSAGDDEDAVDDGDMEFFRNLKSS